MEYPDTHWKLAQQMADVISDSKSNESWSKEVCLQKIEQLLVIMMKKIVAHPTMTSYCLYR
jgi:hypothetical protein